MSRADLFLLPKVLSSPVSVVDSLPVPSLPTPKRAHQLAHDEWAAATGTTKVVHGTAVPASTLTRQARKSLPKTVSEETLVTMVPSTGHYFGDFSQPL